MIEEVWTNSEKRIARAVFDQAVKTELDELIQTAKQKAAAITEPDQLWQLRDWLNSRQHEVESKYDYRYSQLMFVFARLLAESRISNDQLSGLSETKINKILFIASRP